MNNPKVLKAVSIVAFIISALFTIILMTSGTVGNFAFLLTASMAVILELTKCGFFYEALTNKSLHLPIRISLGVLSILLVGSSIFASAGYVQNQANATKNMQTKGSTQYKQLEQAKSLQTDLYSVKKAEIEDLKKLKQQQQANGDNIVAAMPKNYIDKKNQVRSDTAAQISKTQEIINKRSNELTGINSSLLSPIDTTNLRISSDAGYTAMFQTISTWTGGNPESLELWFFIALGVIFEFVAVLTAYLAQLKGGYKSYNPQPKTKIEIPRPKSDPSENNRIPELTGSTKNGWKLSKNNVTIFRPKTNKLSENSKVGEDDIQRYINFVMDNQKNGLAPGRNKIVQGVGMSQEKCRTIHNILIDRGILETGDKCTRIISKTKEVV